MSNVIRLGYVLESVPDVTDIEGIRDAVFKSLAQKLGEFIRVSDFGTCLNQADYSDVPHGVKLVAYHFNLETGNYIPHPISK